ncbi:hypothetical protein [Paenarthrobacter aurescens]|uniref:hypothetical protein n=1 Tax=Paenarthrobacter aurescens TaxID=43663 RepID=UPI0011813C5E|nr:hypothetical protein [Paenarthrobacter aurescens]
MPRSSDLMPQASSNKRPWLPVKSCTACSTAPPRKPPSAEFAARISASAAPSSKAIPMPGPEQNSKSND